MTKSEDSPAATRKTEADWIASLNDGRVVYYEGERIKDVTLDPKHRVAIDHSALDWRMAHDPEPAVRELTNTSLNGNVVSRYFEPPTSAASLDRRRQLIVDQTTRGLGYLVFVREVGTDALNGLRLATRAVDAAHKTDYYDRVISFRDDCAKNDLAMGMAMTDPKGDRALPPSAQAADGSYLRIVERGASGVVIRGAKVNITACPYVNELFVLPTRSMVPGDEDYAIACAVPASASGVVIVSKPLPAEDDEFDYPISSRARHTEGTVFFDNVFVPNERIFLNGETEFAGAVAEGFATWHRFTGLSYKSPMADMLVGAAALMADYNGLSGDKVIREKITDLVIYAETIKALNTAAALNGRAGDDGFFYPDPVASNLGKYYFATNYHNCIRILQDIAGGLTVTGPSHRDLQNPELRQYVDEFLGGREGVSGVDRLKAFKLVRDLTATEYAGTWLVATLHGEGSPAAQRLAINRAYDVDGMRDWMAGVLKSIEV